MTSVKELVQSAFQRLFEKRDTLSIEYNKATTYYQRLQALRGYYLRNEQKIIENTKRNNRGLLIAYPVDWMKLFTPIEELAWGAIRCNGMALYPQYPVINYFLDFGNPYLKIGIELDGRDYHNYERDLHRDQELASIGWKIFRITGSEMVNTNYKSLTECQEEGLDYDDTLENISHWILNTGDGVITSIFYKYFYRFPYTDFREEMESLFNESLIKHCLTAETLGE